MAFSVLHPAPLTPKLDPFIGFISSPQSSPAKPTPGHNAEEYMRLTKEDERDIRSRLADLRGVKNDVFILAALQQLLKQYQFITLSDLEKQLRVIKVPIYLIAVPIARGPKGTIALSALYPTSQKRYDFYVYVVKDPRQAEHVLKTLDKDSTQNQIDLGGAGFPYLLNESKT